MRRTWILVGLLVGLAGPSWADGPRRDVWQIDPSGAATCDLTRDPAQHCVMEMHGQRVMVHVETLQGRQ
jgi:hypothetical protein